MRLFATFDILCLDHRRPQALQSVFGPSGPFLHSGDSNVPNPLVTKRSSNKLFNLRQLAQMRPSCLVNLLLSPSAQTSRLLGIWIPASPSTNNGPAECVVVLQPLSSSRQVKPVKLCMRSVREIPLVLCDKTSDTVPSTRFSRGEGPSESWARPLLHVLVKPLLR